MFFRHLTLFRFPIALDLSELDTRLAEFPLRPVGPLELSSHGFVSPLGRDAEAITHRGPDELQAIWLTVVGEERILPGPVVNELLSKRIQEFDQKQGRRPGGKMRKQMKDDLLQELMPRAFVKPVRVDALIDLRNGVIAVNTSSRKAAEHVVSQVRAALGSLPTLPLNAEVSPRGVMTGWIAGETLPDGLTLGEECELKDPSDQGATVRATKQDMATEEITRHLEAGKQVTKLALNLDDHVSFVLGEDLTIRKFKLLDGALDSLEHTENDDMRAELDARFALMVMEFRRLFAVLERALTLSKAE
ncbi:recombination-associated protein RdgC [Luteimonas sp. SMYT11W]|uniref:Recombination-associated protein RdgC n=1 Tax=Luteimonas flava TaxID=3115822 RepID=A0ABU7WFH6_9GAMM